jgi:SWI/SNF-related matrix-associated actin-dependent regulator of chromatin subfamily B protein 1
MADEELRTAVLPSLSSGARAIDQVTSFTPLLNYVSDSEIEKSERDREKEIVRRRKRGNRGRRGVAMPDREPQRTYRTPGIGFAPIDPANLTAQAILAGPMSRRAAAAAAQINIANMVASENRPEDMEPSNSPITSLHVLPSQNAASSREAKEAKKKSKGLFVAPEYPSSILHARAQVKAPTDAVAFERGPMIFEEFVDHNLPPSMVSRPPDSSRGNGQAWSAKRARELEREAKEQEYMDGQHPNMIDGEWHCSNCGCPASIAIGRRKGPLGEKTQCGICGKYWHRHRKPRPVEYHSDLAYHQNLKDEAVRAKQSARSKKRAPAAAAALERETSEVDLSPTKAQVFVEIPSRPRSITRIQSPMSSDDSGDEAPLASKGKRNGSSAPPDGVSTPALGNEGGSPNQFGVSARGPLRNHATDEYAS